MKTRAIVRGLDNNGFRERLGATFIRDKELHRRASSDIGGPGD